MKIGLALPSIEIARLNGQPPRPTAAQRATLQRAGSGPNLRHRIIERHRCQSSRVPDTFVDHETTITRVADVQNVWMAKPGLVRTRRAISLDELAEQTILSEGARSGSGLYINKWLKAQGIVFPRLLSSDSLTAIVGLTVAGLGVSYLPRRCFAQLVTERKLVTVPTRPSLPSVPYAAMHRTDRPQSFLKSVVDLVRRSCDFSRQLQ